MADEYARAEVIAAKRRKEDEAAAAAKARELAEYPQKCADAKAALETLWPAYLASIRDGHEDSSIYEKKVEAENFIFYAYDKCPKERAWYFSAKKDFVKNEEQARAPAKQQQSRGTSRNPGEPELPSNQRQKPQTAPQPGTMATKEPSHMAEPPPLPPSAPSSVLADKGSISENRISPAPSHMAPPPLPPKPQPNTLASKEPSHMAEPPVALPPKKMASHMAEPPLPPTVNVQGMQTGSPQPRAPGPIVDAASLRAQQGSCSDLTGVGGGPGPSNCTPSSPIPPGLQAQIAKASSYSQGLNPGYSNLQNALEQYRQIEAAFRAADDLANAAIAAEQVRILESLLARPKDQSCPALGPSEFWQDPAYCRDANCFERGTAYYGMLCLADTQKLCAAKLDAINLRDDRRSLTKVQIADLMGSGSPRCNPDGTSISLRRMLEWGQRHKGWSDASTP